MGKGQREGGMGEGPNGEGQTESSRRRAVGQQDCRGKGHGGLVLLHTNGYATPCTLLPGVCRTPMGRSIQLRP